ncbi:hypothetical protein [Roseibium sp.]|uniref:hypothetical protein n=1 Tax=Roseibium sp. TaxID=1936156 RepID=UPI003B504E41
MRQQKSFGKREHGFVPQERGRSLPRRPIHDAVDSYEDPVIVRLATDTPWPAYAAAGVTLAVIATTLFAVGEVSTTTLLMLVPMMTFVGFILFLQFKGLQRGMQGEKEKRKRAIQAKYPLVPTAGMIAGLVYFMITREQSILDIAGYDWSGMFGLRTDIGKDEPLTAQLLETMAKFGGVGVAVAVLWYKVTKKEPAD